MVENAVLAGVGSSLTFIFLNVGMNLYMKWLFAPHGGDFAFPWTMLAVQQLQAYMVLQPWIAIKFPAKRCGWDVGDEAAGGFGLSVSMQVLAVTGLFCLNVGLNSLSLVRISITLNQTVRAFLPVGVLLLATCVERRAYPKHSYVTTALLIIGIALTCWGSPNFEFLGFGLALTSTIVAALGASLNGRLLSSGPFGKAGPEKIARLMMLQSVPAFFIFLAIAALTEGPQLHASLRGLSTWEVCRKFGLVSISSALALMANLGRCFLVAATSALMETLAGNAKVAALCVIDHQLFHTSLHAHNYLGIALTFSGFSLHVLLQYAGRTPEAQVVPQGPCRAVTGLVTKAGGDSNGELLVQGPAPPSPPELPPQLLSLTPMISGAETGLASEHLALRLGRPSPKSRRRWRRSGADEEHAPPASGHSRPRAETWQAGMDPTRTWLERVSTGVGMDLAPVLEPPPWLLNEDTSEISFGDRGSQDPWDWLTSPSLTPRSSEGKEGGYDPLVLSSAVPGQLSRTRIWSDMTHSATNPRPI